MIIYVAALTALLSLLVLAIVYLADLWEREPLELLQNAFLAGLGVQLVLVLGGHRLAGVEVWSGWLYPCTLAALAVVLPILLAEEEELDERFDGIVYAVAFAAGAAGVVHLFNLPRAVARDPESVVLEAGRAPDVRDLLLLVSSPGARGELADLIAFLAIAALAGAVLGILTLRGRPLTHRIAGTLATGVLLAGLDLAAGGGWPVRLALVAATVATAAALKRRSVFRGRRQPPEREIFLGALKTALMILGTVVLALALLLSLTDRWQPVAPPGGLPGIDGGASVP